MEDRLSQPEHDRMVGALAHVLAKGGHGYVKADVVGFDRPNPIALPEGGALHVPDVSCSTLVVEVETEERLDDARVEVRWGASSGFAKRIGLRFFVGVPAGCVEKAKRRLKELGLEGEVLGL